VVDDNDTMRSLYSRIARTLGCHVEEANSGEAVLARIEAGGRFDLILLDWKLPGLDGLATARGLRAAGHAMPIILITGGEPEEARLQAEEGDIQAFLAKPAGRSTLHDTMINVLGGHSVPPSVVGQQGKTPDLSGARILLVDDNDFNRQIGRELVELTGATVDTADDGAQAVTAATGGGYDLVLMDLQMPVMDGYTAARIIRELWPDLPILALTAHAMSEETERVLAAGMNDIITKPILPDVLYVKLARWLSGGARHDRATSAVPPAPTIKPTIAPAPLATADIFDLAAALTRANGNHKMLERFLRLFRDRNADMVTQIGEALAAQDLTTARRLAHALKGGAGTVGLVELEALAAHLEATLERAVQGKDNPVRRSEDFTALANAWPRAMDALDVLLDAPHHT
jgi:CheY-like chemotaxis protein